MSPHRSDLVVLISGRPEAHAFLGILQDWSALGLVRDFLYVDADAPASRHGSPCVSVSGGIATAGRLSTILARRSHTAAARVVCLSQVAEQYSSIGATRGGRFQQEVRDALPAADLTWIHTIAVTVPEQWPYVPESELAWVGAHNVVLAPENSQAPIAGVAPLGSHERLQPVGLTHQTAGLCAAVGLMVDEPRCFFSGESSVGGGQVVAVRTFSRHIALEGIRSEILSRLVDVSKGYPIPATSDGRAQVVADEAEASAEMVDALLSLHPEVRPRERATAAPVPMVPRPFLEALQMFLRFFAGAVRGAPRALLTALEREASTRLAGAAQQVLFGGPDSAYVVTVNGIRGIKSNGTVAEPDEFDQDIGKLLAQVRGVSGSIPAERQEYPNFWKAFVDGALTLLDGSRRNKDLEPQRIGLAVAVVNQPLAVAADPDEKFQVPEQVRPAAGVAEISPYDDDLARTTYLLLGQRIQAKPDQASSLSAARDEIKSWFDDRSRSYAGALGRTLAGDLNRVRQEVLDYADELTNTQGQPSESDEHTPSQVTLARTLLGYAAVCFVLLLGVLGLAVADVLSWAAALIAIPVIGLLWLIPSTLIFLKRQHAVFKFLHEREQAVHRVTTLKDNLTDALVDLRRLQSIYRQYLSWAQGLGTFVRAPLGRVETTADADAVLGEGFCLNHRFGVVVPEPVALDEVSRELQSRLFKVGWLSDAWTQYLEDLPAFRDRHLVEADRGLLYSDRPVSDVSVLAQWSEAVVSTDRTRAAGEIRNGLDRLFDTREDSTFDRLLGTVRARSPQGDQSDLSYGDFVAGLQNIVEGQSGDRRFSQTMFAAVPETAEPWRVDAVMVSGGRGGVRPLIVTEMTRVFRSRDLAFGQSRETSPNARTGVSSATTPPQV